MTEESLLNVEPDNNPAPTQEEEIVLDTTMEPSDDSAVVINAPQWLPKEYWDEESKQIKGEDLMKTLENERKKAEGLRKKLSKGIPEAPETVDGYELNLGDDFKDLVQNDDPALMALKNTLHEMNLGNDVFNGVVTNVLSSLKEGGFLEVGEAKTEEQLAEDTKKWQQEEIKKLGEDGPKVIQALANWGNTQLRNGVFSQEDFEAFKGLGYDAHGISVLNKIISMTGEMEMPTTAVNIDGLPSVQEWEEMHGDPRYENDSNFRRKVAEIGQKLEKANMF